MRIAIVAERADIERGGAERSICELEAALSNMGLEAEILAASNPRCSSKILALCNNSQSRRVNFGAFRKTVQKHLLKTHYDIIHSVLPFDFADIYQPRGGTYAESSIRHAASYPFTLLKQWKRRTARMNRRRSTLLRAEKRLCRTTQGPKVIALSEYVAHHFKKHYGTPDGRIVVIPNGVKTNTRVNTGRVNRLKKNIFMRLGFKETSQILLFLFVANNFRLKGLRVLTRAMATLARHNTGRPAYLLVAGRDKNHRRYKMLAKHLRVNHRIIFLGWLDHIQDALSIIDVAVLPTFYDASSRFILEALAAGKPVITSRFNGATELFTSNRHGKVIMQPEDVTELANAMAWFTENDNSHSAAAAIVACELKKQISVERAARQLLTVYESVLEKKVRN